MASNQQHYPSPLHPEHGNDDHHVVVASAPGKVLLVGAYLILERPNAGLVLSTPARFHAAVRRLREGEGKGEGEGEKEELSGLQSSSATSEATLHVHVRSPQLQSAVSFSLSLPSLHLLSPSASQSQQRSNPFVERAVQLSVAAFFSKLGDQGGSLQEATRSLAASGIDITILGDNDFYSQRPVLAQRGLPLSSHSLSLLPKFSPISINPQPTTPPITSDATATNQSTPPPDTTSPELAKTGLGSSAAMTVAVTAGLLQLLGVVDLRSGKGKLAHAEGVEEAGAEACAQAAEVAGLELVHRISQAAHALAQGKVGSGFDVAAAAFGSQRFVRFAPLVLSPVMRESSDCLTSSLPSQVKQLLSAAWDHSTDPFQLPSNMRLMVGEPGSGGTSTPSMVRSVLRWRAERGEAAEQTWQQLALANNDVAEGLLRVCQVAADDWPSYDEAVTLCESLRGREWCSRELSPPPKASVASVVNLFGHIWSLFQRVRSLLRLVGEEAQVPIEPPQQTSLLDATMEHPGVLMSGVPGAGGYDGVFAIVLGEKTRIAVDKLWESYNVLTLNFGNYKDSLEGVNVKLSSELDFELPQN